MAVETLARNYPYIVHNQGLNDWLFIDDFNGGIDNNTTTGLGRWLFLETAAGATQIIDIANANGVLKLLQTTNDNDVISMQANSGILANTLAPNMPVSFGARWQTADVDDVDFHIGLAIQDTSIAASEPANLCCFRIVEGTATLQLRYGKGSSYGTQDVGTLADATWVRSFFTFWPIAGNTDSGVLDYTVHTNSQVYKGRVTLQDKFPDAVVIVPTIQVQNGSTDADATYVDWIYAHAVRADYTDGTG